MSIYHDQPDNHTAAENMQTFGGSFVAALSEAWFRGDPDNKAKIEATWPELFEKYRGITPLVETGKAVLS